jgi:hypothetical protein
MTRHLSPHEFVDAAEGVLPPDRLTHVDRCGECRQELDSLRRVMTDLGPTGDVPEPSPLFWDHFAGRVRASADAEPASTPSRWYLGWQPLAVLSTVSAVATLLFVFRPGIVDLPQVDRTVVDATPPQVHPPETVPAPPVAAGSQTGPADAPDETSPEAARSWKRVVEAGRGVTVDQVHGVAPSEPGGAVLIEDLTPRELQEFARQLRAQMGGLL